jgi:hypothetical protein
MTKAEFDAMTMDELLEWANENLTDLTTEDLLLEFAKQKIDDQNIYMALHILNAVYECEEAYNGYYLYDYSMGTLETPTPITDKEDLEPWIDFDDEDEEDEEEFFDPYGRRSEMPWDYGNHFDDEEEEEE